MRASNLHIAPKASPEPDWIGARSFGIGLETPGSTRQICGPAVSRIGRRFGDRQPAIDRLALALSDPNPKFSELAEDLLEKLEQDHS